MWYRPKEKQPEGYAGIVLYRRDRNKFYEGSWEEDINMVIIDDFAISLECFDAWCYRRDIFNESNLGELLYGQKKKGE